MARHDDGGHPAVGGQDKGRAQGTTQDWRSPGNQTNIENWEKSERLFIFKFSLLCGEK